MNWNVLTTDPRKEFSVAAALAENGIEVYLPKCQSKVKTAPNTKNEWRMVARPLFPRYLFARMASGAAWEAVHALKGYAGYLRSGDQPATISEAAIAVVRHVESEVNMNNKIKDLRFKIGDRVRIGEDYNPWIGIEGFVEGLDRNERLVVGIITQKSCFRVSLPMSCLREAG